MQTSPGRIPERRWSSTIAQTCRETCGPNRVNERIGDRLDRLRLPDVGPAPTEARNRFQAVMEGRRDHFLSDGPFERPENMPDPLVDFAPTETGLDERLANGLESERPELPGQCVTVELAERPESQPDVDRLRCRLAVLDVIGVGMMEVRQEHFVDGEIGPGGRVGHHRPSARRQPLGDDPIVFGPALGSVDASRDRRHDRRSKRPPGRLVCGVGKTVGERVEQAWNGPKSGRLPAFLGFQGAALSNLTGKLSLAFGGVYVQYTRVDSNH